MKKAIYTVLVGNYDKLRQPEVIVPGWDYICFSNDLPEKTVGVWQIRRFDYHNELLVRESRFPKLNPHLVLPEYEYSLWTDANLRLAPEIFDRAEKLIADGCLLAMVEHDSRTCVYQEARCLTRRLIDDPNIIYRQTEYLMKEGFPPDRGLFVACCMLRKHNDPSIVNFSQIWWNFYCQYSYRDQMSATYSLWKSGLSPAIFWDRSFYGTYTRPHRKKIRHSLPHRCIRFLYSHMKLLRLRLLYARYHIAWKKW